MKLPITGGCGSGNIRYTANEEPLFSIICQCRQCQRITGAGNAPAFAVPVESVELKGELIFYSRKADDGSTVSNGFCPVCGNPVLKKTSGYPQAWFFHAGSLDYPEVFEPTMLVYSDSAQPWDFVDPAPEKK